MAKKGKKGNRTKVAVEPNPVKDSRASGEMLDRLLDAASLIYRGGARSGAVDRLMGRARTTFDMAGLVVVERKRFEKLRLAAQVASDVAPSELRDKGIELTRYDLAPLPGKDTVKP